MPGFSPFRGVRYNAEGGYVDDVIAPPYDVISPSDREAYIATNRKLYRFSHDKRGVPVVDWEIA